jgi:hypothetical protein
MTSTESTESTAMMPGAVFTELGGPAMVILFKAVVKKQQSGRDGLEDCCALCHGHGRPLTCISEKSNESTLPV